MDTKLTQATAPTLPQHLHLCEDGLWEMPSWGRHADDEQWIGYGWYACDYDGKRYFQHQDEQVVIAWLQENGYNNTAASIMHYEKQDNALS
jgi:hypothetical protein